MYFTYKYILFNSTYFSIPYCTLLIILYRNCFTRKDVCFITRKLERLRRKIWLYDGYFRFVCNRTTAEPVILGLAKPKLCIYKFSLQIGLSYYTFFFLVFTGQPVPLPQQLFVPSGLSPKSVLPRSQFQFI